MEVDFGVDISLKFDIVFDSFKGKYHLDPLRFALITLRPPHVSVISPRPPEG